MADKESPRFLQGFIPQKARMELPENESGKGPTIFNGTETSGERKPGSEQQR